MVSKIGALNFIVKFLKAHGYLRLVQYLKLYCGHDDTPLPKYLWTYLLSAYKKRNMTQTTSIQCSDGPVFFLIRRKKSEQIPRNRIIAYVNVYMSWWCTRIYH